MASTLFVLVAAIFTNAKATSHPQNATLARAQAEQAQGQYQNAARDFKAALAESPQPRAVLWTIAQNLSSLGQCDDAARAFAKLHAQRSEEGLTLLGICRFRTQDFPQAIDQLQQAVSLAPDDKRARIGLARALAAGGRNEEAIQSLKTWLKIHPQDQDVLYWVGHLYEDFANQTFNQMAASHPGNYLVYETEGSQDRARQQYPQALAAYQKALSLAPQGTPGLHFYIGDVYWRTLRFEDATRELKEELTINSAHAKANYELGDIYAKEGNPRQAIPYLEKALALNPGLVEAHRSLGRAYVEEKRYPEALHEFLQVAQADPADHTIHAMLANTYRLLGRLKDAQREAQLSQRLENQTIQQIQKNKAAEQKQL